MKKILFVINTLGGAGAEKALIELLKHFPREQYEVSLYVLLDQGELISQIPEHVKVLNREYSDASVLSKDGKKFLTERYGSVSGFGERCSEIYRFFSEIPLLC